MREYPILFSAPMVGAILDGRKTMTRRVLKPQPQEDIGLWLAERDMKATRWAPGDILWVREGFAVHLNSGPVIHEKGDGHPWGSPIYRATFSAALDPRCEGFSPWRPSIHMPRWASRITLTVEAVRVERLQDISEADVIAEGGGLSPSDRHGTHDPQWILGRCRDCRFWDTNVLPNGSKRMNCPYNYTGTQPNPPYGDGGQGCSHGFELSDGTDETAKFQFRHLWERIHGPDAWDANPWVSVTTFRRIEA